MLKLQIYQKHIQQEVSRIWHPPLGVSRGTESTVQFSVDKHGRIKTFEFIKKSSVLIYNLSITRVAKNFKFNKCLWNKKFTIV